jgi:hypothetical protein
MRTFYVKSDPNPKHTDSNCHTSFYMAPENIKAFHTKFLCERLVNRIKFNPEQGGKNMSSSTYEAAWVQMDSIQF